MQAAQLAANEHTLASPEATAQMYVDQVVNGAEIDGLTPLHLALCNGTHNSPLNSILPWHVFQAHATKN